MPRYARLEAPGAVHHLISRFVNEEYRLTGKAERDDYLARMPAALTRSDWSPLSYALMSTHVHWGMVAGDQPSASFVKPLHAGFAFSLNRLQERLGPVFADRHRSIVVDAELVAGLIAYIHNNPVRAGVVESPAESEWTSHRAYVGLERAPAWLDVERGLSLCGFDASPSGRLAFHDFVVRRGAEPRSTQFSATRVADVRARVRAALGSSVETSWPALTREHSAAELVSALKGRELHWRGDPRSALGLVCAHYGIAPSQLATGRRGQLSLVRRAALRLWTRHLGRAQCEILGLLGLSAAGAVGALNAKHDWRSIDVECTRWAAELRAAACDDAGAVSGRLVAQVG